MRKVAAISIGQTPRTDITGDITPFLSEKISLVEYGALDAYSEEELRSLFSSRSLRKESDEMILVSRLRDKSEIVFPEAFIIPLVQACITKAELEGCDGTILYCTGEFPHFQHTKPLVVPRIILYSLLNCIGDGLNIGVLLPNELQKKDFIKKIEQAGSVLKPEKVVAASASPYQGLPIVLETSIALCKKHHFNLLYLDCMGYSIEMKQEIEKATGIPVLLPRTMATQIVNEIFGI